MMYFNYIHEEAQRMGVIPYAVRELMTDKDARKPLLSWAIEQEVLRTVGANPSYGARKELFQRIAKRIGVPSGSVPYLMYTVRAKLVHLEWLKRTPEYSFIKKELLWAYPSENFWDSVLPYVWLWAKKLVAKRLLQSGWDVVDTSATTGLSERTIYYIRRELYDTKSNTEAVSQV